MLSEVRRDRQALAQNLRLRTRKTRPEKRTYSNAARQEEQASKTPHFLARFSFSTMRSFTSFITSAAGSDLSGVKCMVAPLTSYPLNSPSRARASLGIMLELIT